MVYWGHLYHGGITWGVWLLGILLTVAFWGLLIIAIIWLVRGIRRGGHRLPLGGQRGPWGWHPPVPPAEAILAERFARGEIDEDEYRVRLAVLRGAPGPSQTP